MATVVFYFAINTGSSEKEAETAAQSIFCYFLLVPNLHGATFFDTSRKPIKVLHSDICLADVTYLSFVVTFPLPLSFATLLQNC